MKSSIKEKRFPDMPSGFEKTISLTRSPVVRESRQLLTAAGTEPPSLLSVAWREWESYCLSGTVLEDQQRLQSRGQDLKRNADLIKRLKSKGLPTEEAEAGRAAIQRESGQIKTRIKAAETTAENNQKTREQAVTRAEHSLGVVRGKLAPSRMRGAMVPVPADLERREVELERELEDAQTRFDEGAVELAKIGKGLRSATEQFEADTRESLQQLAIRFGREARSAVPMADRSFVMKRPNRLPIEVDRLHRLAERLDALIDRLGGRPGEGLNRFYAGAGDLAPTIQRKMTGFAPPRSEKGEVVGEAVA